jgi:hypothetical protein
MDNTYKVIHTVKLVTEFNLNHPSAGVVTSLSQDAAEKLCRDAFIGLARGERWLEEANERGSWAILRFAEDGE